MDLACTPFYRRYPYTGGFTWIAADRRTCYEPKLSVLFTRINKSASTSVYLTMAAVRDGYVSKPDFRAKHSFVPPSRMNECEVAGMDQLFKFVFVRNPYTRLVSCYLSNVLSGKTRVSGVKSFADFVSYLEDGHLYANAHWVPQPDMLTLPVSEYDFIGRVESFDHDMRYVLSRIDKGGEPLTAHTIRPSHAQKHLREHVTPETMAAIERMYGHGFDMFGYDRTHLPL